MTSPGSSGIPPPMAYGWNDEATMHTSDQPMDDQQVEDEVVDEDKDAEGVTDDDEDFDYQAAYDRQTAMERVAKAAGPLQQGESSVQLGKRPRKSTSSDEEEVIEVTIANIKYKTQRQWYDVPHHPAPPILNMRYEQDELENADWICKHCISTKKGIMINNHQNSRIKDTSQGRPIMLCNDAKCGLQIDVISRRPHNPTEVNLGMHSIQAIPVAKGGEMMMGWLCGNCSPNQRKPIMNFPDWDECNLPWCQAPRDSWDSWPILAPKKGIESVIRDRKKQRKDQEPPAK